MFSVGEDVEADALFKRGWTVSAIARHLERDRKTDLAGRPENLARAQDEARDALGDGGSAVACGRLFAAFALLNPRHAAGVLRTLAQSSTT